MIPASVDTYTIRTASGNVTMPDEESTFPSTKNSTINPEIELIFLGTGTSSSVPSLDCLTAPPSQEPCRTCLSTLTPEGKKNIRRNTSAVVRVTAGKDGKKTRVFLCCPFVR
ncbi:hypothetical protein J3R82DRAFT_1069 [Butyriboletus roseoflavus]|nr:hypothetical protein J3R82DRAFT_1069 [Butyriboletus roseoflavus]